MRNRIGLESVHQRGVGLSQLLSCTTFGHAEVHLSELLDLFQLHTGGDRAQLRCFDGAAHR